MTWARCLGLIALAPLLALAEVRGVPKDDINKVVQEHRSEVRECYETALKLNSTLKGKVVVAFDIEPDGKVSSVSVRESAIADAGLPSCLRKAIKSWVFPKAPVKTEVVAYPFYFNPLPSPSS